MNFAKVTVALSCLLFGLGSAQTYVELILDASGSMWNKLEAAFGSPPDLALLLKASDDELRAAGMSRQKAGYIRSLAELVLSGELDLDNLPADDEEAIGASIAAMAASWTSSSASIWIISFARSTSGAMKAGVPCTSPCAVTSILAP